MAFVFVKFPKKFLDTEEWRKPRKYSKAEALIHLLSVQEIPPIRELAKQWQWSKSTVADFIANAKNLGYFGQNSDKSRTQCTMSNSELRDSIGQISDKSRTHLIRDKENPPILSSTKVESNIIPPRERDFIQEVSLDFQDIVEDWLSYKRDRKESYKSHRSLQAFYSQLKRLSHDNPTTAREIINQSMANNWAGIFQLKNDDTKRTSNTASNDPKSRLEGVLRAAAEGISRANTSQEWESRAVGL